MTVRESQAVIKKGAEMAGVHKTVLVPAGTPTGTALVYIAAM